jgi:hypothetical protein
VPNPPVISPAGPVIEKLPGADGTVFYASGCTDGIIKWSNGLTGSTTWIPSLGYRTGDYVEVTATCKTECSESAVSNKVKLIVVCPVQNPSYTKIVSSPSCTSTGGNVTLEGACPIGTLIWFKDGDPNFVKAGNMLTTWITGNSTFRARCEYSQYCVSDFAVIPVTVGGKPNKPNITSEPSNAETPLSVTFAINSTIVLTANGCPAGSNVNWILTGYSASTAIGTSISIKPTVSGTITARATCSLGDCSSDPSDLFTITTPGVPTDCQLPNTLSISPATSPISVTVNTPVTLSASGCIGGVIGWYYGQIKLDERNMTASSLPLSISPSTSTVGSFTYSATCNIGNCEFVDSRVVNVTNGPCPNLSVSLTQSTVRCGSTDLVATSPNTNISYQWYFRANATSTESLLTTTGTAHTATANGEYKVKIIDNTNLNCFATSSWLSVTMRTSVSVTPVACCASTINRGSTTTTASLNASNCPSGTTYVWSDSQTGASIIVSPTTTTTYTVKCRETNAAFVCESANSAGVEVTVTCSSPTPILKYDNPTSKVCPDQNISIKATGCTGTIKWYEAATGGSVVSTGTPYTTNKGIIWATCTASGSTCESARTSIETQIDFGTVGILTSCDFDKFTATPTDESKFSYEWAKNNVPIVGQTKSFIDNPTSGSYVVTVGLKGSQCAKKSSNFSITLPQNKRPTVSLTPSSNICGDITLTATLGNTTLAIPPYTYVWKKDGTVIDNEVSSTYTATSSGAYTVVVTSNNECSGQATLSVTVTKDLPKPTIKNTYGYSCYSSSRTMTLEAQGCTNGSTPKWSTGATTSLITVTSAGTYTVKCEKNGCSGSFSDAFVITDCASKPTYCGQVVSASGNSTPYDYTYDYNGFDGTMYVTFNTYCVPDKMTITRSTLVNGAYVIIPTGILPKCMGSGYTGTDQSYFSKDDKITYSFTVKQGDKIRIQVAPNCASGMFTCPSNSTIWDFTISCPDAN